MRNFSYKNVFRALRPYRANMRKRANTHNPNRHTKRQAFRLAFSFSHNFYAVFLIPQVRYTVSDAPSVYFTVTVILLPSTSNSAQEHFFELCWYA